MDFSLNSTRLLAAVMFVDIVGYTAMMQQDEKEAIGLRNRHRRVLEDQVNLQQGHIVQYYGDGALIIFTSSISAVKSAIELQKEMHKHTIPVRVGIHMGEIVYTGDGVYGNAVNIAARIESLSTPGGIFISDKIGNEIKNHPEFKATLIGIFKLKNVNRPISVYAIKNESEVITLNQLQVIVDKKLSNAVQKDLSLSFVSKVHAGLMN